MENSVADLGVIHEESGDENIPRTLIPTNDSGTPRIMRQGTVMSHIETLVDECLNESHPDELIDGNDTETESVTSEMYNNNVLPENVSLDKKKTHITIDNIRHEEPVMNTKNKVPVIGGNYAINFCSVLQKKSQAIYFKIQYTMAWKIP
ncbi:hypothetical protein JTB14_013104 [Gonioctena quinquepunctata]|nr:hypothetical protein JTB14_013104 [Gonioctena quinquepunctata]